MGYYRANSDSFFNSDLSYMTREEEEIFGYAAMRGNGLARNALVVANLYLAEYFAKKYKGCGVDVEDLVQDGCEGLVVAARKYNPKKGRFASYARFYVLKYIFADIEKSHPYVYSLDNPVSDDEEGEKLVDFLPDTQGVGPECACIEEDNRNAVDAMVNRLPFTERECICRRFGLKGYSESDVEEIALESGISPARVESSIQRALRFFRTDKDAKQLMGLCA